MSKEDISEIKIIFNINKLVEENEEFEEYEDYEKEDESIKIFGYKFVKNNNDNR